MNLTKYVMGLIDLKIKRPQMYSNCPYELAHEIQELLSILAVAKGATKARLDSTYKRADEELGARFQKFPMRWEKDYEAKYWPQMMSTLILIWAPTLLEEQI